MSFYMFRIRAEPGRIAPECTVCICTLNRAGKARLTCGLIATKAFSRILLLSNRNGTDFEIFGFRAAFGLCRGDDETTPDRKSAAVRRRGFRSGVEKAVVGLFKETACA